MPLLDSYATIGIKKTCFTLRVRERQADKNINWPTVVSRSEKIRHALRWIAISCSGSKKERKNFYRRIFFSGYPRARQPIASYLSKHKLFEIFKSYSWSYDEMLIDWVKSYIILIYKYEVTVFPKLEIFVKHRSLYDSLHLSVGAAEFSQLQCFSCKMTVFSRAWGLCRIIDNSFFFNTSPFNLPPVTSYKWQ